MNSGGDFIRSPRRDGSHSSLRTNRQLALTLILRGFALRYTYPRDLSLVKSGSLAPAAREFDASLNLWRELGDCDSHQGRGARERIRGLFI
jgi:hypothetical protein